MRPASPANSGLPGGILKSGALEISASDWMALPAFEPVLGNMSAVFVIGTAFGELKTFFFDKLAGGADRQRFQALHEMPFGVYGQFYDEYSLFKRAVESILRRSSPG